jgi:hypothetical protein
LLYIGKNYERVFDFGGPIEAGGGGDCGYYSLGIKRTEFVEFLKKYSFPKVVGLPTLYEMLNTANKSAYTYAKINIANDNDNDKKNRDDLIELYSKPSTWMTLEDFNFVSTTTIVSNRNLKPLNEQIIYLWSFLEGFGDLQLVDAFYKGDNLRTTDTLPQLIMNHTPEQHIYFNGTCHFQQLKSK